MSAKKHGGTEAAIPAQLLKEAHALLDELEVCVRHLPHGSSSVSELTDLILKLRMQLTKELDKSAKGAS